MAKALAKVLMKCKGNNSPKYNEVKYIVDINGQSIDYICVELKASLFLPLVQYPQLNGTKYHASRLFLHVGLSAALVHLEPIQFPGQYPRIVAVEAQSSP